ncbi:MAG: hypothetical protein HYZ53_27840 [Planctomycetes bacterium]|nr:hypothetical protein [Planctomycetota bacterium]
MAAEADAKLVRTAALKLALALAGKAPVKTANGPEAKAALQELSDWWKKEAGRVQWDAAAGRFRAK